MKRSGDLALPAGRKLEVDAERLSIDLGSHGVTCCLVLPAGRDVLRGARNA